MNGLMNDSFQEAYESARTMCTTKGYALVDIIKGMARVRECVRVCVRAHVLNFVYGYAHVHTRTRAHTCNFTHAHTHTTHLGHATVWAHSSCISGKHQ